MIEELLPYYEKQLQEFGQQSREFAQKYPKIAQRLSLNQEQIDFSAQFYADNFSDSQKSVIGIHPGAAKEGNVWPQEKFAELMNLFNKKTIL